MSPEIAEFAKDHNSLFILYLFFSFVVVGVAFVGQWILQAKQGSGNPVQLSSIELAYLSGAQSRRPVHAVINTALFSLCHKGFLQAVGMNL